jgi:hypothetical protein
MEAREWNALWHAVRDPQPSAASRMIDERLRRIQVLESQVEGNKEVVAALRELEENDVVRIDESTGGTTALVEIALTRIEELREIIHGMEGRIDALAISLNRFARSGASG